MQGSLRQSCNSIFQRVRGRLSTAERLTQRSTTHQKFCRSRSIAVEAISARRDFPCCAKFVHLSAANVAPTCRACKEEVDKFQNQVYESFKDFDDECEEKAFEPLHQAGARLFGCHPSDIAGGSSATELLQSVAWAVMPAKGKNVVATAASFPSVVYPWQRVCEHTGAEIRLAPYDEESFFTKPEDVLGLIDEDTAVVTLSHVEFTCGQVYDLAKFARRAHEVGALLIVDATQSAGAIPIDVTKLDVDVMVSAAYKWLCGAFGAALMYLRPSLQSTLNPGLVGFRSHEDMWKCDARRLEMKPDASRFEYSTMHFGSVLGLAAAIDYVCDLGVDAIFEHNMQLADEIVAGIMEGGLATCLCVVPPSAGAMDGGERQGQWSSDRSPIVTARIVTGSTDASKAVTALRADGISVTNRNGMIRFAPHLYNSSEDVAKALAKLAAVFAGEAAAGT